MLKLKVHGLRAVIAGKNTDVKPDRGSTTSAPATTPPSTPRLVIVFGIIVIALLVLFVVLHLAGGGYRGH